MGRVLGHPARMPDPNSDLDQILVRRFRCRYEPWSSEGTETMVDIPMNDILPLWNETKQHNWSAFHKTLEQHRGKTEGIESYLVDLMLVLSRHEEKSGAKYPDSPQQLHQVLNQRLEQEIH